LFFLRTNQYYQVKQTCPGKCYNLFDNKGHGILFFFLFIDHTPLSTCWHNRTHPCASARHVRLSLFSLSMFLVVEWCNVSFAKSLKKKPRENNSKKLTKRRSFISLMKHCSFVSWWTYDDWFFFECNITVCSHIHFLLTSILYIYILPVWRLLATTEWKRKRIIDEENAYSCRHALTEWHSYRLVRVLEKIVTKKPVWSRD
jgi:hypothetical protein